MQLLLLVVYMPVSGSKFNGAIQAVIFHKVIKVTCDRLMCIHIHTLTHNTHTFTLREVVTDVKRVAET